MITFTQTLSYLCSQFKLNLIHEDETVGVGGLWPAQKHPVLVSLPGHRAWNVVSLFWTTRDQKKLLKQQQMQQFLSVFGS